MVCAPGSEAALPPEVERTAMTTSAPTPCRGARGRVSGPRTPITPATRPPAPAREAETE